MARTVHAVERALDILELFLAERAELSASDVMRTLELPRTTVHELLLTLTTRGYLSVGSTQPTQYKLGIRNFQLGSMYRERLDLAREGQLIAELISARCGETVHLGVRDARDVTYIVRVDSSHSVRMVSEIGRRLPAHCTAVGKSLLAGLSPEEFEALYRGTVDLPALTPSSISSVEALRREIEGAKLRGGVSREYCESNQSVACVGAPVRDHTGNTVAALSISVPLLRWDDDTESRLADLVSEGAARLSETFGFHKVSVPA